MLKLWLTAEELELATEHQAHALAQNSRQVMGVEKGGGDAVIHRQGQQESLARVALLEAQYLAGDGDVVALIGAA